MKKSENINIKVRIFLTIGMIWLILNLLSLHIHFSPTANNVLNGGFLIIELILFVYIAVKPPKIDRAEKYLITAVVLAIASILYIWLR